MPFSTLDCFFSALCDILHRLRMGDVEMTPPPLPEDTGQTTTPATVMGESSGSEKEIYAPEKRNGRNVCLNVVTEHDDAKTPEHHTIPSAKHGSNGSAHFIAKDDKPLDTTVDFTNININVSKDTEQEEEGSPDGVKRSKISLRAAFSHRDNKKRCINFTKKFISSPFGVFCLILFYLCVGACIFMWMERAEERRRRTELIDKRYDLTKRLMDCKNDTDPTECMYDEIKDWEKALIRYPLLYIHLGDQNSSEPQIWNWANAFYGCFSIITTIGYGTIAPLTPWGRLYAVLYAVVGIPLMLLLVADIGGQLARVVKIAIIAFRKRREASSKYWKNRKSQKESPQTTGQDACKDSPRMTYRRDTFDLTPKGCDNLGMEDDEHFNDSEAKKAHMNGINLHLEVAGRNDSDSSYSSCSNCEDHSDIEENESPSRKRRKYLKKTDYGQTSSATGRAKKGKANRDMKRTSKKCMDETNSKGSNPGIRIEIEYDESDDNSNNENENGLNETTSKSCVNVDRIYNHENGSDSQLYDALGTSASDYSHQNPNDLPKSEHQINEFDSISQCSIQSRETTDHLENTRGMLDVPALRSSTRLSSHESLSNDDGIASVSSSIHTTASNAPTVSYKSDLEVPRVLVTSPCRSRSASIDDEAVTLSSRIGHNTLPVIRIDQASDSDTDSSRPNSPSILRKQRKRSSTSQVSSVSINVEPHHIDVPVEYRGRAVKRAVRKRKTGSVNFGAAMGSFSSVSENDIAFFSIPLWLALLLLFVYLLIGACCYSLMEDWTVIDSFYYAFISLSTVGFGDLYFVPESFAGALVFNFVYCFIGLSFVSMVWSLSSREFTLLAKKIATKIGYYKSRRWRRTVKGWTSRMRQRSIRRWSSRRRNAVKVPAASANNANHQDGHASDTSCYSSDDEH